MLQTVFRASELSDINMRHEATICRRFIVNVKECLKVQLADDSNCYYPELANDMTTTLAVRIQGTLRKV